MNDLATPNKLPLNSGFHVWVNTELRKTKKYLYLFCHKKNKSVLHKLRVQLKKASTIELIIRENISVSDEIQLLTHLQNLSKRSAIVRQKDVEYELLKTWDPSCEKWVKKQRQSARKGRKKLAKSIHRHQKRLNMELNILKNFSKLVSDEKSDEFVNRLWEETLICLQFEWEDSGLHKLRKHLKHMLYALDWWDSSHKQHVPAFTKSELSALEKAIGQWHDKMEMLENMLISGKNHMKLPQIQIIDLCIAHCHAELEIVHKQLKAFRYLYIPELI
jgi:hypothetical protein